MADPVSAGIGAAVGIGQLVVGAINNRKAKKEARELEATRPTYSISDQAGRDLALAESELGGGGGLSAGAQSAYNNLNNQQFSSSLNAILKGGGSVNNVGSVFGENEEGRQRLALLNDQMRLQKINNLNRARTSMINEEDKAFMYNIDQPWKDKAQAVSSSRQQAQAMIGSGIGSVANTAMQFAGQNYNEKMYRGALGKLSSGGEGNEMWGQQTAADDAAEVSRLRNQYNEVERSGRSMPTLSGGREVNPPQQNLLTYQDPEIETENQYGFQNWFKN